MNLSFLTSFAKQLAETVKIMINMQPTTSVQHN